MLDGVLDNGCAPVRRLCDPHHDGFTAAYHIVGVTLSMADKVEMLEKQSTLNAYFHRCSKGEALIKMSAEQ